MGLFCQNLGLFCGQQQCMSSDFLAFSLWHARTRELSLLISVFLPILYILVQAFYVCVSACFSLAVVLYFYLRLCPSASPSVYLYFSLIPHASSLLPPPLLSLLLSLSSSCPFSLHPTPPAALSLFLFHTHAHKCPPCCSPSLSRRIFWNRKMMVSLILGSSWCCTCMYM